MLVFNLSQFWSFGILGIFGVWLTVISFFLFRQIRHYNRLVSGEDKASLREILEKIFKKLETSEKEIDDLVRKLAEEKKEGLTHIQKVGLLRFNPFEEVGGDQSFVLALLDGEDNGVVMTSLTSRTGTRWYGKTVKNGRGAEHELSSEEKEAVNQAARIKS